PPLSNSYPTDAQTGKLRIMRQGTIVRMLAAEGNTNTFSELCRLELGAADVLYVRAAADAGDDNSPPLVARFLDIEFRGREAPPTDAVAVPIVRKAVADADSRNASKDAPADTADERMPRWQKALLVCVATTLALAGSVWGWFFVQARRRRG